MALEDDLRRDADRTPELVKGDNGDIRPLAIVRVGSYYHIHAEGTQNILHAELDPATGKLRSKPNRLIDNYVGLNARAAWSPDDKWIAYHFKRGRRLRPRCRYVGRPFG